MPNQPPPTRRERFKALIAAGIRPEDAVAIIDQSDRLPTPVDDTYLAALAETHDDDRARARTTIYFSSVVDDAWRGLWDATPLA